MLGGLDGQIHFKGAGIVQYGAEPTAEIDQVLAGRAGISDQSSVISDQSSVISDQSAAEKVRNTNSEIRNEGGLEEVHCPRNHV